MSPERLVWRRDGTPRSFIADLPGGGAAKIFLDPGVNLGRPHWRWRIDYGDVIETGVATSDQQSAADAVNQLWPGCAARQDRIDDNRAVAAAFARKLEGIIFNRDPWEISDFGLATADRELLRMMTEQLDQWERRGVYYLARLTAAVRTAWARTYT